MVNLYCIGMENKLGDTQTGKSENDLTFLIDVGKESDVFLTNEAIKSEPSIFLEENIVEEEEFASHEIVDEPDVTVDKNTTISQSNSYTHPIQNELNDFCFAESVDRSDDENDTEVELDKSLSSEETSGKKRKCKSDIKYNIKKKKHKKSPKKGVDILSVVLRNVANNRNENYTGIKMMVDPKSGSHIVQNNSIKPLFKETNSTAPWLLDKHQLLQDKKEKLFVKSFNSKITYEENTQSCHNCNHSQKDQMDNALTVESPSSSSSSLQQIPNIKLEVMTQSPSNNSLRNISWEEGNMTVSNFYSLSEKVKTNYPKSDNYKYYDMSFSEFLGIPSYGAQLSVNATAASGVKIFSSWEAVKERIEKLEEETMTKFTLDYKTPTFKNSPEPFKKIQYHLDTTRKGTKVTIPNSGIPFIFMGTCLYSCHLGKRRLKSKELDEDLERPLKTKRIGCPAQLSVWKLARFPDFDITDLSPSCESDALNELKDLWDFETSKVRFYIEYQVQEPNPTDHKGHELQYLVNSNRLKEPVDPRIVEKIRELTRQGHVGLRHIHTKVEEFIRQEIFKGDPDPPLHRRRYNPTRRDLQYAMAKAKGELKREGKSLVQLQCSALAEEISQMVKTITQERYLKQLKAVLSVLRKSVKNAEPLENLFHFHNKNKDSQTSQDFSTTEPNTVPTSMTIPSFSPGPYVPKILTKRRRSDAQLPPVPPPPTEEGNFLEEPLGQANMTEPVLMEQFYINVGGESSESVFGTGQLYAQDLVDMNTGLVDTLPAVPEDATVTEVYYYYPDGTCELATSADTLTDVQT